MKNKRIIAAIMSKERKLAVSIYYEWYTDENKAVSDAVA